MAIPPLSQGANLFLKRTYPDGPEFKTALSMAHLQYITASRVSKENEPYLINRKNCQNLLMQAAMVSIYRQAATFAGNEKELEECLNKLICDLAGNDPDTTFFDESNSTDLKKLLIQEVLPPVLARIKAEHKLLHMFWMGSRDSGSGMYRFFQQTNGRDLVPTIFSYVHEITPHMANDSRNSDKSFLSPSSTSLLRKI